MARACSLWYHQRRLQRRLSKIIRLIKRNFQRVCNICAMSQVSRHHEYIIGSLDNSKTSLIMHLNERIRLSVQHFTIDSLIDLYRTSHFANAFQRTMK